MKVRTTLGSAPLWLVLACATALGFPSAVVQAACLPAGSAHPDTIICSDIDSQGVSAGSGDDRVTVLSGATVSLQVPGTAASPVAIDAGAGADTVLNYGSVLLSLTAGGGAAVSAGGCPGWAPDDSARGIYGAGGADSISNFGTVAVAGVFRVPAAATTLTGGGPGCPFSSGIAAIGLDGGEQSDRIANHGVLQVSARVEPGSVLGPLGGASPWLQGPTPAPEPPGARAWGMVAGDRTDPLKNDRPAVMATTAGAGGAAPSKGDTGGNGGSELINDGTITVTANSDDGGPASAVGMVGGNGNDRIENHGTLAVSATAAIESLTASLSLIGGQAVTATTVVESRATGIDGGNGRDEIINTGTLTATADSGVLGANLELNLLDTSHGDTSTYVRSFATGIAGGNGPDAIGNSGTITAQASSTVTSFNAELNTVDAATGDSLLEVDATATGIASGRGPDSIDNAGSITAIADAGLAEFGVNASFVDLTIADRQGSNLSSTLTATATAIDGAQGKEMLDISHTGSLAAQATANALSIGVALASEGVPGSTETLFGTGALASIGITSNSRALGITGGGAGDLLTSAGAITATADSGASQASINVGVAIFDFKLPTPGLVLGSAGTGSHAQAGGIDTGHGNDEVSNTGTVGVDATADADATTVSVNIAELSVDFLEGVPGIPLGASLVVADTATEAGATASGIATGAGHDTLTNTGVLGSNATASSGSASASATLNTKFGEGENFFTLNAVAARAVTAADADAVGLDTGSGSDRVVNDGGLTVGARADAYAVTVGVDVAGTVRGKGGAVSVALTDSSSEGTATAAGIRAGDGDDEIANNAAIAVTAEADVIGVSGSVTAGVAKQGLVAGAALARSESIATTEAVGIDAGAGADDVTNSGAVGARANADADAVSVSATIEGATQGIVGGAALVDTGATASATAVGIRTGSETLNGDARYASSGGGCHPCAPRAAVVNTGTISADAEADTAAVGVSANVGIVTREGAALGAALARTSAAADATAVGIAADARDDAITHAGGIGLRSLANADAVSVSLNVEGTATGLAAGASLVDASVTARATAAGIAAGAGDDEIVNSGTIGTLAGREIRSEATAVGVAAGAQLAVKQGATLGAALADTSATATTIAAGIDAGSGDDSVRNTGDIALARGSADADAVSVSVELALARQGLAVGAALARGGSTAELTATGMLGADGRDALVNENSISLRELYTDADAVSVSLSLVGTESGVALGAALVDAEATATTNAVGLSGGDDSDRLVNLGSITVDTVAADTNAVGVAVGLGFAQQGVAVSAALAQTGATSNATAKGLDGGAADDKLVNAGTIALNRIAAESDAVSVTVDASATQTGVAVAASLADASGRANTAVTGMDGGSGDDTLHSTNAIAITGVDTDAHAASVAVGLAGTEAGVAANVTLARTGANAAAVVRGMSGASGADQLQNESGITIQQLRTDADAQGISVGVAAAIGGGVAAGVALSDTSTTAGTAVTAMDGGSEGDWVSNSGSIVVNDVVTDTDSTSVSAEFAVSSAGVALGVAVANTRATSTTDVTGLDGGTGSDRLSNDGSIALTNLEADADAVSVGMTLSATPSAGIAAGVTVTDAQGRANLYATGMEGGAGDDKLFNRGSIVSEGLHADAHATGVSVSLQGSALGAAGGAALADTRGVATTVVRGMHGGAGNDLIRNDGTIDLQGQANADALSIALSITGSVGLGGGVTVTDAGTAAQSLVAGIEGGDGRDDIANYGTIDVGATAVAESTAASVGISVAIGGDATLADAESTATATAVGIYEPAGAGLEPGASALYASGRPGHDDPPGQLVNLGAITAGAAARSEGLTISGNLAGYALGETTNTSTADAAGIRFDPGPVFVYNAGAITATSSADTSGLSISVGLAGANMGDASSRADARARGIESHAGDDAIENLAAVTVSARSQASANSIVVGLAGASLADATITAIADAAGLDGGAGDDTLTNHGALTVSAGDADAVDTGTGCSATAGGACAKSTSVGVRLAGAGSIDAGTRATADASGMAGGDGRDALVSDGAVSVSAHAKTGADGVSVAVAGAALSDVQTSATAHARGIAGDAGDDHVATGATITARASSAIVLNDTGVSVAGAADFDATLAATAIASAIDGGAGRDHLHNAADLAARAGTNVSVSGDSVVVFGASSADTLSGAVSDAAGIRGGADADKLWNRGAIDSTASAALTLGTASFSFGGAGGVDGRLVSATHASGIAGDAGADRLYNEGVIGAHASATLGASGAADVVFGAGAAGANAGAVTQAVGLDGGADDDVVDNRAGVAADADATVTLSGSSFTFGGTGGASGALLAGTEARAIGGGAGDDTIANAGALHAMTHATLTAAGDSDVAFGQSTATAAVGTTGHTLGIDAGDGHDRVVNAGRIEVDATASLSLNSTSFNFGGAGGAAGSLAANARATGIGGGAGDDAIENAAEIVVNNTATLTASSGSDVAFGSSGASATSGSFTVSSGIDGGDGNDVIANAARIEVHDSSMLSLSGSSYTFGGTGDVGGQLSAGTDTAGIRAGAGHDVVRNHAEIAIDAHSTLTSGGRVNTTFGTSASDALATSDTRATGIDAGAGDDRVKNFAKVGVAATSTVTSENSAYVFGGTSATGAVAKARASADGLVGGDGDDYVANEAEVDVRANASVASTGSAYAEFGGARTAGEVVAAASATGMSGGAGNDTLVNRGTVDVAGTATATSTHSTDTGFLFGGGDSRASASATLAGYGVDAGDGDNLVVNEGHVGIEVFGSVTTSASSDGADIFDGDAFSRADSAIAASAIGVRAGGGADVVINRGDIAVDTSREFTILGITLRLPVGSSASAYADGDGIDGDGTARAYSSTTVFAGAIDAGDGDNAVANDGTIRVDARGMVTVSAGADSDAGGSTSVSAVPTLAVDAFGVRTGGGQDVIENTGTVSVAAMGNRGHANAWGIDAGAGDNLVANTGDIATSVTIGLFGSATGIASGVGSDRIDNGGQVRVDVSVESGLFVPGEAQAVGISSGGGGDAIHHAGTLTVNALASSDSLGLLAAESLAIGIRAGDGGAHVKNTGTIGVQATATSIGILTTNAEARAIGIQTGSGDDTIVNHGTITATEIENGIVRPGTAIDSGGGNDTILLGDGSVTNGDIDLGSGTDTLSLEGTPVINGGVIDGLSTVSLVFNNDGRYDGGLPGLTAIKNGQGTFTLSALNRMERIEVNQGTLRVTRDYQFLPDSLFQARVHGDGSHGRFLVDGAAGLDGKLRIARGDGAYVDGRSYEVLKAGAGLAAGTAFTAIELPAPTRLVSFNLQQDADAVQVESEVASFATVAAPGNPTAVAQNLDRILPAVGGDLNRALAAIQTLLGDAEFAAAFASLSPAVHEHYSVASLSSLRQYGQTVEERMTALRVGERTAPVGQPRRLAFGGDAAHLPQLFATDEEYAARPYGLWLKAFAQQGRQDAYAAVNGYEHELAGVALGIDRRFGRSVMAGVSVGQARNEVTADIDRSDADIDSRLFAVYGSYFDRRAYVTGTLSAGRNDYDTRRTIVVGASTTPVTSTHDGDVLAASLGAGSTLRAGESWLDPYLNLQYTRLEEDGFSEDGSGAGLVVAARTTRALVSVLGLRWSRIFKGAGGTTWTPEASLSWLHDFDVDGHVVNAAYVGAPDASFSIDGQPVEQDGAVLGLGVAYRTSGGLATFLRYTGELRDHYAAHGLIGELRYEF